MKSTGLNFCEKIHLYFRCKKDVLQGLFRDFNTGEPIVEGVSSKKAISPFFILELSQFIAVKDRMLGKKICFLRFHSKNNHIYIRIKRFPNAMALIDDRMKELQGSIELLTRKHHDSIDELQEKYRHSMQVGATHIAQLYVNEAQQKLEEFQDNVKKRYETMIFLAGEKIRLINILNAKINIMKSWRFLRIRYYYSRACASSVNLPIYNYSEEEFSDICTQNLNAEFTGLLEDAKAEYDRVVKAISTIQYKKINESASLHPEGNSGAQYDSNEDSGHE